jgi:hypothetical protein
MPRIRIAALLLLATALLAAGCGGSDSKQSSKPAKDTAPPARSVLAPGLKWTITVQQDSSGIVAEADDARQYDTQYDFAVTTTAKGQHGTWVVTAHERDAQGPFSKGFQLSYRQQPNGSVKLTSVRLAGRGSVPADQARGVVGVTFPLEATITRRPRSRTVQPVGAGGGSALPPALPGTTGGGSTQDLPPATPGSVPGSD